MCHQPHKKRKIRNVKPTSQSKKKIPHFFFVKTTQQLLLLQIIFSVTWSKPALSEIQTLPILFFVHPNRNIRTSRIEEKKILETMKKKTRNWVQQRIFPWICFGFLFTLELQRVNDDVIFFWTLPNLRKKPQFFYVPLLFYLKKKGNLVHFDFIFPISRSSVQCDFNFAKNQLLSKRVFVFVWYDETSNMFQQSSLFLYLVFFRTFNHPP